MFTGLVESLGEIRDVIVAGDGTDLVVAAGIGSELTVGESVAVNGACLTVVERGRDTFRFQAGPETLRRTNLGQLRVGDRINLERSVRLGDRLGGHIVQGHIDGLGKIADRQRAGEWETVWFACPAELALQMVRKGSVAVDGVSLTVSAASEPDPGGGQGAGPPWFEVSLIPETLARTTLGRKQPGATVNLEADMIAKYVEKLVATGARS